MTMKIKPAILLFAVLAFSRLEAAFPDYPKLKEIQEKLLSTYSITNSISIDFAKTREGIYIVEYATYTFDSTGRQLFWSAKTKTYQELTYRKSPNREGTKDRFLNRSGEYQFDKNLYYGYDGWYNDAIQDLEKQNVNSDKLLYAFSRAYSAKAFEQLGHGYSGYVKDKINTKNLSKENIDYGISCANKSIDLLYKVYKVNPLFETLVGNIYDKYSNECLCFYYLLETNGMKEPARQFLRDSLYTNTYYDLALNLLNSCEGNSVLITGGDNDTYPLLYLQEKKGIKKNVKIVNISLCNANFYVPYLVNSSSIKTAINQNIYGSDIMDMMYRDDSYKESNTETLNFKSFAEDINNNGGKYVSSKTGSGVPYLLMNNMVLSSPLYTVNFSDERYIERATIFLTDLIMTNSDQLNIYFSNTLYYDDYKPYRDYLEQQALVCKVGKIKHDGVEHKSDIYYAAEKSESFLKNTFVFRKDNHVVNYFEKGILRITYTYRMSFSQLAQKFLSKGNKAEALKTVDRSFAYFPYEIYGLDYYCLEQIDIYYKAGNPKQAEYLSEMMYKNVKDYMEGTAAYSRKNEPEDVQLNLAILDVLSNIAGDNNKPALKEKYYNTLLKYYMAGDASQDK